MKPRHCLACGQPLQPWTRVDKVTCTGACRTRLCRQREDARNTFVTGRTAVAPRSGAESTREPVRQIRELQASPMKAGQLDLWTAGESSAHRAAGAR